jgi:hypothetical protein
MNWKDLKGRGRGLMKLLTWKSPGCTEKNCKILDQIIRHPGRNSKIALLLDQAVLRTCGHCFVILISETQNALNDPKQWTLPLPKNIQTTAMLLQCLVLLYNI